MEGDSAWRERLDNSESAITEILTSMRRIAVIGIKRAHADGPSYSVPATLQQLGFDVVPVPVYYPEITEILGRPVHRTLATIAPSADLVLMFRRSTDISQHVDEILAAAPRVVWMQLGIRNDAAAERFARTGIQVVQDRCIAVELRRRDH